MAPRPSARERDTAPDPLNAAQAPPWLVRSAAVGVRLLVLGVLVWLLAELATRLTLLLVALLVGLLLAGAFAPLVRSAERRKVPRGVSAAVVVALLLGLLAAAGFGIGQRVSDQLPELRTQLQSASQELSSTLGVEIPGLGGGGGGSSESGSADGQSGGGDSSGGDSAGGESGGGSSSGNGSSSGGSSMFGDVLSSVAVVFDVLIGFFLTLAFMFLFLTNGERMWGWALEKVGGRLREDLDAAGRAAWRTTGAYVRGLTIVAVFDAVATGLGLVLLGVPLALTLAVLLFIASYIPTVGAFVAGAVAVAVAFTSGGSSTALVVLALVVVVQQVGNIVIEPYVMGRSLPMNALMVLVAVVAGGLLWGVAGALLFVPLTAAVAAAGRELWERRGRPPVVTS